MKKLAGRPYPQYALFTCEQSLVFACSHNVRSWKGKPSKGSTWAFETVCMRGAMLLLPLKPQTLRCQKPKTQYYLRLQSVAKVREIVRVLSFLQSPHWCLQCVSKHNIKDRLSGMTDNTLTIKEGYLSPAWYMREQRLFTQQTNPFSP